MVRGECGIRVDVLVDVQMTYLDTEAPVILLKQQYSKNEKENRHKIKR